MTEEAQLSTGYATNQMDPSQLTHPIQRPLHRSPHTHPLPAQLPIGLAW